MPAVAAFMMMVRPVPAATPQSPYYEFTAVARPGSPADAGGAVQSIEPSVSINEKAECAFIARLADGSEQVLALRQPARLINLSRSPAGRNFDFPQINNQGRVVTRELLSGNSLVRLWNTANTGSSQIIASSTLSNFSQVTLPTVGNTTAPGLQPVVGFLGRLTQEDEALLPFSYYANDTGRRNEQEKVSELAGSKLTRFRAQVADSERRRFVVQFSTPESGDRIAVYEDEADVGLWSGQIVATTANNFVEWVEVGAAPGISGTGQLVAFAGEGANIDHPRGIYLASSETGFLGMPTIERVLTLEDTVAFTDTGAPIKFASIDFESPVAVTHFEAGVPGLEGDWAVISFTGTPDQTAWPTANPDRLRLFSGQPGLWTVRVDFERHLQPAHPPAPPNLLVAHATPPIRVVQEGDILRLPPGEPFVVTSFAVHDPLALATFDQNGRPRRPGRGDHHIAFTASNGTQTIVVRGGHLDTDEDGLPDHWEEAGKGIDADGDGVVDLKLASMWANPLRKDAFLEVDWLNPRTSGATSPWSNEPAPGVMARAAAVFAAAPVSNPDGSTGITLHVDAGPGADRSSFALSYNMPPSAGGLGGGQLVGMPEAVTDHPDLVYLGVPGSLSLPGAKLRSLTDVKREFFENRDKGARELAFRYVLFADFNSLVMNAAPPGAAQAVPFSTAVVAATASEVLVTDNLGAINAMKGKRVLITQGRGTGQIRYVASNTANVLHLGIPFAVVPDTTSRLALLIGYSGIAEVHFRGYPDYHGHPGNDFMVTLGDWGVNAGGWLADGDIQWRTLVHEMGHTLALRHGGVDHEARKGNAYQSLMSYSWQLATGSAIQSFSGSNDPTFNDWAYVKHDFSNFSYLLGNSFGLNPKGESLFRDYQEPTYEDYLQANGKPPNLRPPVVALLAPVQGATVPSGPLNVVVSAADDIAVKEVVVRFDRDGDGQWDETKGEIKAAAPGAGGTYATSFPGVTGPFGARRVLAVASDISDNQAAAEITVLAGSGAGAGSVIRQASGTFVAQGAGGPQQTVTVGPIAVPSSGLLTFTVAAEPPVRQAGQTADTRFDAAVESIQFSGEEVALQPVCTSPGQNPSVCTSTWQAAAGGSMYVRIAGPAVRDAAGALLAHPSQNYQLTVTFQAIDVTPPVVSLVSPGAGAFAEIGRPLIIDVQAADDFSIAAVTVSADLNGDGDGADGGESLVASALGGGVYRATFTAPAGEAGIRRVRAWSTDTSGLAGSFSGFIELRVPDTMYPDIAISSPPPGWPVKAGDTLSVVLAASDNIELSALEVSFDLNGDGTVAGAVEKIAASKTGVNQFSAVFSGISGPNGPRALQAAAIDTSGNLSPAESVITVGGVTPVTETIFTDNTGSIPAQSYLGSQQVIPYAPLNLPSAGTVKFTVTATPPVRQAVQNIERADPFVRDITFNGTAVRLYPSSNAPGSNPAICSTSYAVPGPGTLGFSLLGPGVWNTFGEFTGHVAQTYTLKVEFTSVDVVLPEVAFVAPARGADASLGTPLTVQLDVTDQNGLASVLVLFDGNGDGDTGDTGESKAAALISGNRYEVYFAALTGTPGNRTIEVLATDHSFNTRRTSISIGTGGVGTGETLLASRTGTIAAQPIDIQGGRRQIVTIPGIAVPGMGRLVCRVDGTPPVRQAVTNLERHDPTVSVIRFNGQTVRLTPECNAAGSNPAICVSKWDSPGAGNLELEILGPAQYNTFGEFIGHPEVRYGLTISFLPGPAITAVAPSSGSTGGGQPVTVSGSGFAFNAVILFDGIPATSVKRVNAGELTCLTPPGALGSADLRVINPDPEGLPWNYGIPYGLFGTRPSSFTYYAAPTPGPLEAERLLGTWPGAFAAAGEDDPQQSVTLPFDIPGAGRLRFSSYAFIPILNPIPGPYEDPSNLDWHNESSAVRSFRGGNGTNYSLQVDSPDLSFPYGPVISTSTHVLDAAAAGNGTFTVLGPARWNAFWRQFGDFVMTSAPAQDWVTAAWFAAQPTLTSIEPAAGGTGDLVTLRGSQFANGVKVQIGGMEAPIETMVSPQYLTCRVPSLPSGRFDVSIELLAMTARLAAAFQHNGSGGPNEDADGDGLVTLVEQFMGLNPQVNDASGAMSVEQQQGALFLTYRRALDAGGLAGWVEWSDDLSVWEASGIAEVVIRDMPGETYVVVAAVIPAGGTATRFARLKVQR